MDLCIPVVTYYALNNSTRRPNCGLLAYIYIYVGEWGWGVEGKQVGSMDEEPQVRGCCNVTFICTPTNQETVSVLEKTQANKHLEYESKCSLNNSNY